MTAVTSILSMLQSDTVAPSTPGTPSANAISSSRIDVSWTASSDNVAVKEYQVKRCSGAGCSGFLTVATSSTNNYSDTGLASGTIYRYIIVAVDYAGNASSPSSFGQATTL